MAKLYFRYGSMDCGKTTLLLQTAYDYANNGIKYILIKPGKDTKGSNFVVSRAGGRRKVDYMIDEKDSILDVISLTTKPFCILVDEAQFLTPSQIDELYKITKEYDIPVVTYGLRCDFQMQGFPGSTRLLQIADDNKEIETICRMCFKENATQNLRLEDEFPIFDGEQVAIDGVNNTSYVALCGKCYLDVLKKVKSTGPKSVTFKQLMTESRKDGFK